MNKQNPKAETKFIALEVSWHVWNQFQSENTFIVLIVLHSSVHKKTLWVKNHLLLLAPEFLKKQSLNHLLLCMNIIGFLLRSSFPAKSAKHSQSQLQQCFAITYYATIYNFLEYMQERFEHSLMIRQKQENRQPCRNSNSINHDDESQAESCNFEKEKISLLGASQQYVATYCPAIS